MKTPAYFILFLASLLFAGQCVAQQQVDVVILKNGSKIVGTIVEQVPNKQVKIRTRDGSEFVYTFDEIEMIRKEDAEEYSYELIRDFKYTPYTELGVSVGTPAGLNFMVGHWFGIVGTRLSGMYLGSTISGIQANIGFKLSDNSNRSHVLAAVFGTSHLVEDEGSFFERERNWTYIGAAYNLNLSGFHLEAGLTVGDGNFSSPQIILQLGYMYRFLGD
ncbi:MAG: hypothetical protein IH600_07610 [Bacteroidetes bacterium]|nr:hypothetical protein [Bacteroidota bacterium]